MTALEGFLGQILLSVAPNLVLWGVVLLILLALFMKYNNVGASTMAMASFITIWQITIWTGGGVFEIVKMFSLAALGVVMVLAILKLANR